MRYIHVCVLCLYIVYRLQFLRTLENSFDDIFVNALIHAINIILGSTRSSRVYPKSETSN